MSAGKDFEALVREGVEMSGGYVMRIPDPQLRREEIGSGPRSFTRPAPFDLLAFLPFSGYQDDGCKGPAYCSPVAIECKSTKGKSFPFDRVRPHQVDGLTKHVRNPVPWMRSGVMIEFRDFKKIVYIDIDTYCAESSTSQRKSLTVDRAVEIGQVITVEVLRPRQRKKRPRITFDALYP